MTIYIYISKLFLDLSAKFHCLNKYHVLCSVKNVVGVQENKGQWEQKSSLELECENLDFNSKKLLHNSAANGKDY